MKKWFIKLIICFFDKYALDAWIDIQNEKSTKEVMEKNDLKTMEEFNEFMIERNNEQQEAAYNQGKADGYEKAMEENY